MSATDELERREEVIERARSLAPVLARHAAAADEHRRLSDEVVGAIEEAGLFGLLTTRRLGGLEADVRTTWEALATLGESCGSAAWVTAIINGSNLLVQLFDEQAQEEVAAEGRPLKAVSVFSPSGTSEPAPGGLVISGSWAWASGSWYADWALCAVPVTAANGEVVDQAFALIPISDLTIEDTWFTSGMRGTASNTLVADRVFVPEHRLLSLPAALAGAYPEAGPETGILRVTLAPLLATLLSAPLVGLARGAATLVREKAPRRGISYTTYTSQVDSPVFAAQLGEAAMIVRDAELHGRATADAIDAAAAAGVQLDDLHRTQARASVGHVTRRVRDAFDLLLTAHGASSFAEVNAMQRMWRDASAGARHAVLTAPVNYEIHGRGLLGVGNITPLL